MTDERPPRLGWQTRAALLVGLATLVALAAFLVRERGRAQDAVFALVRDAGGIREGAPVSYRGVDVGRVSEVTFTEGGVLFSLSLDRRRRPPLRREDTLRTVSLGLFGDRALRIVPGPPTAPLLEAGDTLRTAASDTVLQATNEAMVEAFRRALGDSAFWRGAPAPARPPAPAESARQGRLQSGAASEATVLGAGSLPVPLRVTEVRRDSATGEGRDSGRPPGRRPKR